MASNERNIRCEKYVLVTAAHNEEALIEKTIFSVVAQTARPVRWIIVDDKSSDSTPEIVRRAAEANPFIQLLRRKKEHGRSLQEHVYAINEGYAALGSVDFDFIGNLDADITFGPEYFARLLENICERPSLGIGGGWLHEEQKGVFIPRISNSARAVPNGLQLFRRECYEAIGGYTPVQYGSPDWYAEVSARMKGWRVESFPDLPAYHLRPTGSAGGRLRNSYRQGLVAYSFGSHPVFEVFKAIRRIPERPYVVGSVATLLSLALSYLRRDTREAPKEFIRFLRREQKARLKDLLFLKHRSSMEAEQSTGENTGLFRGRLAR